MSFSHCSKKTKQNNQAKREHVSPAQAFIYPAAMKSCERKETAMGDSQTGLMAIRHASGATATLVIKKEMQLGDNAACPLKIRFHP